MQLFKFKPKAMADQALYALQKGARLRTVLPLLTFRVVGSPGKVLGLKDHFGVTFASELTTCGSHKAVRPWRELTIFPSCYDTLWASSLYAEKPGASTTIDCSRCLTGWIDGEHNRSTKRKVHLHNTDIFVGSFVAPLHYSEGHNRYLWRIHAKYSGSPFSGSAWLWRPWLDTGGALALEQELEGIAFHGSVG